MEPRILVNPCETYTVEVLSWPLKAKLCRSWVWQKYLLTWCYRINYWEKKVSRSTTSFFHVVRFFIVRGKIISYLVTKIFTCKSRISLYKVSPLICDCDIKVCLCYYRCSNIGYNLLFILPLENILSCHSWLLKCSV